MPKWVTELIAAFTVFIIVLVLLLACASMLLGFCDAKRYEEWEKKQDEKFKEMSRHIG